MRATHKDLSHLPRARQLQTYVWVTWCCARAGQKKKTVACDKFLAALCSETLRDIEPRAGGEVLGYWGARDCLWIVPSEKATARVRQEFTPGVLKTLYEGKTIYDSLNAFTSSPTGLAWRHDDSLRWSEHLREDKHDMFARIAGQGIAAIRYRGELLIGYDDDEPGVVLIGTRKAVGVSGLSCRERYWWLCQPEGMVDRYPEERVAPWWTPERDAELAAWGTPNPETVRAAVADLVRAPDGTAPKIVLVTDRVETTEWSDSRDVVLASHTDWLTTSTRVLRDITTGHVPACTHGYRVFAREHFGAYLSRRPWVWSKYFGREHAFVLAVDPEHVAESLGVSSFTRETIARSRETMPDGMLVAGDTPVVRVTGRVGTGKSVLLYQIACKDPGVVVCVRPWMEVRHWEFLRKVLQSASLPITFVVDDVDPLVTDFGMLSAILAFRPQARQRVRLLVSLESSAAALPDCARFFDGLGFVSVALDPVDPSYLERVLRASAAMMGASLSDAVLAATVEAAVRSGETLGYTLSLLKGLGTAGADVAGPQWFFKGATSIDDRDALSLLLLVEGCHWCMCRRMPLAALQALYEYHCGVGAPFADVAARLVDGGWLVVDNDEALTDSPWSEGHPITQVWQEALQHPRWTRLSGQAARWVALTALAVRTRLAIPARQAIFNGAKAIAAQRWHSDALLLWRAKLEDVEELSLSQCLEDLDFLAYLWASVGHRPGYVRDIQSLMASKERRDALWTHAIVFMRKAGWREECESFMAWLLHGTAEERVERGYEVFNRVAHSNYSDWDWLVRTYRLL